MSELSQEEVGEGEREARVSSLSFFPSFLSLRRLSSSMDTSSPAFPIFRVFLCPLPSSLLFRPRGVFTSFLCSRELPIC